MDKKFLFSYSSCIHSEHLPQQPLLPHEAPLMGSLLRRCRRGCHHIITQTKTPRRLFTRPRPQFKARPRTKALLPPVPIRRLGPRRSSRRVHARAIDERARERGDAHRRCEERGFITRHARIAASFRRSSSDESPIDLHLLSFSGRDRSRCLSCEDRVKRRRRVSVDILILQTRAWNPASRFRFRRRWCYSCRFRGRRRRRL